jgi:hypothetical protein
MELDLAALRAVYKSGSAAPSGVVVAVYERFTANRDAEI